MAMYIVELYDNFRYIEQTLNKLDIEVALPT